MADSDQSINNLRFNQVSRELEGAGGGSPIWTPLIMASAGGITQLTGDVTAGPGSGSQATTLATVNSNVGSFTSANITVDAKGRITAASNGSAGPSFTPASFTSFGASGAQSSSTFADTVVVQSFAMANASHRVRVTVVSDGFMSDNAPNNGLEATIAMDGSNVGRLNYIGGQNDVGQGSIFGTIAMQWVFAPGDTASHAYSYQNASQDNVNPVTSPFSAASILIEEIV